MSTNEALATLRAWRYDPAEERPHPREILAWAVEEPNPRGADVVVQLQVFDLLARCVHPSPWGLRFAAALPWSTCERCNGDGEVDADYRADATREAMDDEGLSFTLARDPCPQCDGASVSLDPVVQTLVRQCEGWSRFRRDRGRAFIWHGLDYALHWTVGQSAHIEGDPPRSTLSLWYRRALEDCQKHGHLLAVDLACSEDERCRRVGERLLGRRCARCDGTGEGYAPVELSRRHGGGDAFRLAACTACGGSGSIVRWWAR